MATEAELNAGLNAVPGEEVEVETEEVEAPEVETAEVETEDEPEPAERPLSRSEERFQKLANERAEAKSRAEQAERERDFYRAQAEQARQPVKEEEDLDPMTKWQRDTNIALQRSQFQNADMVDQSRFLLEVSQKPSYAPFADAVEKRLQQFRQAGGNPTRKQVLAVIAGEAALEKLEKAPALKREAAARVSAARGKPLGTATNVPAGKASQSTFDRLKDLAI